MDVKMFTSGQKTSSVVITTKNCYYKGAILVAATSKMAAIYIHNCKTTGAVTAANMVAELAVPAVACSYAVDNPTGVIPCPNGITLIVTNDVGGSCRCHVRASGSPK